MTEKDFNLYVSKIRPRMINFAKGFMTKDFLTAEDMVQDAISKVWVMIKEGRDIKNLDAITTIVLKNICLDYIKLKKNNSISLEDGHAYEVSSESNVLSEIDFKERMNTIEYYVSLLSAEQQAVLRLRDIMGYELTEIAEIVNVSAVNVRVILSRARSKMREYLINKI